MSKMARILELTGKAAIACLALFSINLIGAYPGNSAGAQSNSFDMTSLNRAANRNAIGVALGGALGSAVGGVLGATRTGGPVQAIAQVAQGQLPMTSTGMQILPVVSTGSVNINSCDLPFIRSNGGSGAFPSDNGTNGSDPTSGGGSAPDQGMPDLPPGYIGVQNSHNGGYMGAVPPGGNIVDFFKGAYGLAPGEEAEANYILNNQLYQLWQSGEYAGLWGPYEQSGPPGGGG